MALIKCPECNNNISDQADICPKCGYELNKKIDTNSKNKSIVQKNNLKYLILVLIVVIGGFFFFQYNNKTVAYTLNSLKCTPFQAHLLT